MEDVDPVLLLDGEPQDYQQGPHRSHPGNQSITLIINRSIILKIIIIHGSISYHRGLHDLEMVKFFLKKKENLLKTRQYTE